MPATAQRYGVTDAFDPEQNVQAGVRYLAELMAMFKNNLSPMEFMQRLAALVPGPRLHLIRFHGVLAPNAKLRSQVVPVPPARATAGEGDCQHAHSAPVRMTWARLLKRVFDIDIERSSCGGKLKLVAVIEEPAVIEKILTHLGLAAQPPPRAPARRRVDLLEWA